MQNGINILLLNKDIKHAVFAYGTSITSYMSCRAVIMADTIILNSKYCDVLIIAI